MTPTTTKRTTLRINLNYALGVTFATVRARLPLYRKMGIRRLYLSCPFHNHALPTDADPRSAHGYNPFTPEIDPKLGGIMELRFLCRGARELGIDVCLDVVHHMHPENVRFKDNTTRHTYFCAEPGDGGVSMNYAGFGDKVPIETKHEDACAWLYGELKLLKDEGLVQAFRVDFADGLGDWHHFARWLGRLGLPIWYEVTRQQGQRLPTHVVGTTGGDVIAALLKASCHGDGLRRIAAAGAARTGSALTFGQHMDAVAGDCMAQDWYRCHAERLNRLLRELDGPEVTVAQLVDGLLYFRARTHPDFQVGAGSLTRGEFATIEASPLPDQVKWLLQLDNDARFDRWIELFWRTVTNLRCMAFRIAGGKDLRFVPVYEGDCGPDLEPLTVAQFHETVCDRLRLAAQTFVTDSTHDTRLGPRQRARAAAVTHYADLFLRYVECWQHLLAEVGNEEVPGPDIEWLVLTTLAVLPVRRGPDGTVTLFNIEDVFEYIVRIAREGGGRTSWLGFNHDYERRLRDWLGAIYSHERFVASLAEFHNTIDPFAETLALGWVLLRLLPGQPQFDEVCLVQDVLLADPHCRARADIEPFAARVESFERGEAPTRETAYDWVVWQVLKANDGMDASSYQPVTTDGGSFAFRAGAYHVCVPFTPDAKLVPPDGDGWRNLTEPLDGISPGIGLFVQV